MIGNLPPRPTGTGPDAIFMQWVYEQFMMLRMQETPDARTSRTSRGFQTIPNIKASGITISTYRFKSMASDHIVCRTWDGTTDGATDVNIAKPPELWFSVASETLRGDLVITYSAYSLSNQSRTATKSGATETQVITRAYVVNDVIWAAPATTYVSNTSLIDLNRGARAWMAQ